MVHWGRWLRNAAGSTAWLAGVAWAQPPAAVHDFHAIDASAEARGAVAWIRQSGDAQGRAYAVVDKRAAHLYVFEADGRLAGHSPALLGSTLGDHTVAGVGEQAQTGFVPPGQRTTPAGRFEATPGVNHTGEPVIWVEYESAFAIHRLRPGFASQARAERLTSAKVRMRRVSWGCVVVPVAFYEGVVQRVLGASPSVVYVLPETGPAQGFLQAREQR